LIVLFLPSGSAKKQAETKEITEFKFCPQYGPKIIAGAEIRPECGISQGNILKD
jgi:hypothetical protein